jgi:hypothetical protein
VTQAVFHLRVAGTGSHGLFLRPLLLQFRMRFPSVHFVVHGDTLAPWVYSGIRDVTVEVDQSLANAQAMMELPSPFFGSQSEGFPYAGMVARINDQLTAVGAANLILMEPFSDPWIRMPELPRTPVSIKPKSVFWDAGGSDMFFDAAFFRQTCQAYQNATFYFLGKVDNPPSNGIDCNSCTLPELVAISRACRLFVGHPLGAAYPFASDHARASGYPPAIVQQGNTSGYWRGDRVVAISNEEELNRYLSDFLDSSATTLPDRPLARGLFLNPQKAQCSIHESGAMAWECLRDNAAYQLDYLELSASNPQIPWGYDFYLFNYHHVTMAWLDTGLVQYLPGLTTTLVLETLPNNPYVLCPAGVFDVYCALDPTMEIDDRRVYAFPRPLERNLLGTVNPVRNRIPVIGTFGFPTPGKGFELVVDAVNREFDKAIIRINIPAPSYSDVTYLHGKNYTDYLEQLCRSVAKPGIEVEVTRDFLSKEGLIKWCAENTLNCFLYNRDQPGLSATTDQAITSGKPLAVSDNPTFRHLHRYLTAYPYRSLRQSIEDSGSEVMHMRNDWSQARFAEKFVEVLADHGLLKITMGKKLHRQAVQSKPISRPKVLLVSHRKKQCGIYQYGKNLANALANSRKYEFVYGEAESDQEFQLLLRQHRPKAIIYNYYPATMPWFTVDVAKAVSVPQLGIMHEVTQTDADNANNELFDFHICPDPTLRETNSIVFKTGRLIPRYINFTPLPDMVTIGSFGFGFPDKGFEKVVELVQHEFDRAKIRFHIPFNDNPLVEKDGHLGRATAARCRELIRKPGIELEISHDFLDMRGLLDFLAGNTLNVFLYDEHKDRGISSTIEHALAVQRPLAISRCGMFRHVISASPSIIVGESSLSRIVSNGIAPLVPFYGNWSEAKLILRYEEILAEVF